MEFQQVVRVCLDFSIANDGTIQSYPAGQPDRLEVQSRTTRTAIFVERGSGVGEWRLEHRQDAAGGKPGASATVTTGEGLRAQLVGLWG